MRTVSWTLATALALGLVACGDNGTETDGTTDAQTTTNNTTEQGTSTVDPTTAGPTTVEPTTMGPTTLEPTTVEPTTDDTMGATTVVDTTGGGELTCDAYCGIYMQGCKDNSEYQNMQACQDQCGQWPPGALNETEGDTLGCRLYHVTVASMTDPDVHCPHAGPSGFGVCVDADAPACADYCAVYFKNCTDDLNAYQDEADCMSQCAAWWPGKEGDVAGDSVGCREYHAGAAAADAALHCPHAGPGGADVCVTP